MDCFADDVNVLCVDDGAIVQYKPVSCPEAMRSAFQESCAAECPSRGRGGDGN